jgi:hypothetical protein
MPVELKKVSGTLPHPQGEIEVKLGRGAGGSLKAEISLPSGSDGVFAWKGVERPLTSGKNILNFL